MGRLASIVCALAATTAGALAIAPAALADSGTITITSAEPVGDFVFVSLRATVTKDTCDDPDNCSWYAFISQVAPGQPCTPDSGVALPSPTARGVGIHGT